MLKIKKLISKIFTGMASSKMGFVVIIGLRLLRHASEKKMIRTDKVVITFTHFPIAKDLNLSLYVRMQEKLSHPFKLTRIIV